MRIAVDIRALQLGSEYRGIGAYIVQLLRRMPVADGPHEFVFLRFDQSRPLDDIGLPDGSYEEIVVPRIEARGKLSVLRRNWHEARHDDFGDLAAADVDVFWQPDLLQGLPDIPGLRTVVTMYDLIPLVFPGEYLPPRRLRVQRMWRRGIGTLARHLLAAEVWTQRYRRLTRRACDAGLVLSISEATTDDLVRILGMEPSRIRTIPLGAPEPMSGEAESEGEARALRALTEQLQGRPFLLYVGGLDHRRRLSDLVGAYDELRRRGHDLDLVLVGRDFEHLGVIDDRSGPDALEASPYGDGIRILGFVREAEKFWLFRHAAAFVFPSLYEGFGLPVLEAMVNRCPVITYRNSSLPEVVGEAGVLVDPPGALALADAIAGVLDDPARHDELVAAGSRWATRFSWDDCARETLEAIIAG